jgi:hypothetical protein
MKIRKNIAISDSGLIFDPVNGESFSVNPIGVEIITYFKEGKSFEEIGKLVTAKYNTDKDTFEKDFHEFIMILDHHNLIEHEEAKKA